MKYYVLNAHSEIVGIFDTVVESEKYIDSRADRGVLLKKYHTILEVAHVLKWVEPRLKGAWEAS